MKEGICRIETMINDKWWLHLTTSDMNSSMTLTYQSTEGNKLYDTRQNQHKECLDVEEKP